MEEWYSNVSRGKRQQEDLDEAIPCILEPQGNEKALRKSWDRLIQKISEVDPLVCPLDLVNEDRRHYPIPGASSGEAHLATQGGETATGKIGHF